MILIWFLVMVSMPIFRFWQVWPKCSFGCSYSPSHFYTFMDSLELTSLVRNHSQSQDSWLETLEALRWCAKLRELLLEEYKLSVQKAQYSLLIKLKLVHLQIHLSHSHGAINQPLMNTSKQRSTRTVQQHLALVLDPPSRKSLIENARKRTLVLCLLTRSLAAPHKNVTMNHIYSCKCLASFPQKRWSIEK